MVLNSVRPTPAQGRAAVLDGRYQLLRRLHATTHGMLHLAIETRFNRHVAIKAIEIGSEGSERFSDIVQFLARLDHPNCINVIDTGTVPEGLAYAVMPFIDGERLRDIIASGPIEPSRAARLAIAILRGLAHLHRSGAVHRDLKPECIVVPPGDDAALRITDFWSAWVPSQNDDGGSLSLADLGVGTPEYTSPEQALGMTVDGRGDLYAVGVILFEMLHGRPPFRSDDAFHVVQLQIHSPLPPFDPNVPEALVAVIRSLTQKDPCDRPAANDAIVELETYLAGTVPRGITRRSTPAEPNAVAAVSTGRVSTAGVTLEHDASAGESMEAANGRPASRAVLLAVAAAAVLGIAAYAIWPTGRTAAVAEASPPPTQIAPAAVGPKPPGSDAPTGGPALSKTLQSLALVNERRTEYATPFVARHALIAELREAGHGEKIDEGVRLELDLRQAGDSPTPCATFAAALAEVLQRKDPGLIAMLGEVRVPSHAPGAGVAPDASCDGLAGRLEAAASPPPAAVAPAPVIATAPPTGDRHGKKRREKADRDPPPTPVAAPRVEPKPTPSPVSKLSEPAELSKLEDDIKRL